MNRSEDEREAQPPPNVVPFPTAHADDVVDPLLAEKTLLQTTKQVAAILKVPVSDSLQRVTADYLADPRISLLGEADAAREWIDDPRRNRKRQQLTPAFFRRWLKREQETTLRDHAVPPPEHRLRGQARRFASVASLFDALQECIGQGQDYHDLLRRATDAPLLILDDVDKLKPSEFREETLYKILNGRSNAALPLAISSNSAPDELTRRIGAAGRSRLMAGLIPVPMYRPDYRLEAQA